MARRVIARFVGTNREFKKYLETLRASEVVSLDGQKKKPAPRRTKEKLLSNSISRKEVEAK